VPAKSEENVRINPELSDCQKSDLEALLNLFDDVISDIPGCTKSYTHKINLTDKEPIRRKPYPMPINVRGSFDKEVENLIYLGIIEPSSSDYCSPVVMVRKPDDSFRLCIDFRNL
jgi:hypothetical protein